MSTDCRFKETYEGLPAPAVQDEVARFLYLHHHGGTLQYAGPPSFTLTLYCDRRVCYIAGITVSCLTHPSWF